MTVFINQQSIDDNFLFFQNEILFLIFQTFCYETKVKDTFLKLPLRFFQVLTMTDFINH